MNDMKEDARSLFDIARSAHEPTSREHERVLRGVLARGAIVAGVTSASVGSAAAKGLLATSRAASTLKILVGFAIFGATGVAAYRVATAERVPADVQAALPRASTHDNGPKLVRPLDQPAAVPLAAAAEPSSNALPQSRAPSSAGVTARVVERPEHELAEKAAPVDERALAQSPATLHPAAPAPAATQSFATSAPPSAATSAPASAVTLTREARALADVQRALREGRSTEALAMLVAQNREFAGGALGQEREAARIMALCAAGRVAEGRPAAERFLTTNPGSPVATHIRSSCGVP